MRSLFNAKTRFFIYIFTGAFLFIALFFLRFSVFAAHQEAIEGLPIPIEPITNYENLQGQAIDAAVTYAVDNNILEAGEDYVVLNSLTQNSGSTLTGFYLTVIPADSFSCNFSSWATLRLFDVYSTSDFVNIHVYTNGYIEAPFNNGGGYHWQFNSDHLYDFFYGRVVATRNIDRIFDVNDILAFQKPNIDPDNPPQDLHSLDPEDYDTPDTDLPDPDDPDNLLGSIKGFFQGLINKIVQAVNNVKNAIVDGFNTLFSNLQILIDSVISKITTLIEGVTDFFAWVTEPLDTDAVYDAFLDSSFGSLYTTGLSLVDTVSSFFTSIGSVTAPTTLEYSLDFSGTVFEDAIPDPITFNFNWYNSIRNTIVPLLTAFVYFTFLLRFTSGLPNIINGVSSFIPEERRHTKP